jgi:hypothetical protein
MDETRSLNWDHNRPASCNLQRIVATHVYCYLFTEPGWRLCARCFCFPSSARTGKQYVSCWWADSDSFRSLRTSSLLILRSARIDGNAKNAPVGHALGTRKSRATSPPWQLPVSLIRLGTSSTSHSQTQQYSPAISTVAVPVSVRILKSLTYAIRCDFLSRPWPCLDKLPSVVQISRRRSKSLPGVRLPPVWV